ncbi:MAG: TRAM domain-containing protein [Acidobacteriota bacterium]
MLTVGSVVTLRPEKPVAGGRMLARHDGRIVLVAGAIPGETLRARIERVDRSTAWASMVEVLEPHAARRRIDWDCRCGGADYAHVAYATQLALKADLIRDALMRVGRHPWSEPIPLAGSPELGYRMRCRVHTRNGPPGFFVQGTHTVCDPGPSGQLLTSTIEAIRALGAVLLEQGLASHTDIDVSENIPADRRAVHVQVEARAPIDAVSALRTVPGVSGLSWSVAGHAGVEVAHGEPWVEDVLRIGESAVRLRRHVRAFFQANRYLLPSLAARVVAACPDGPVVDLFAGGGLFAVSLAADGRHRVTAVEGDAVATADLRANAAQMGGAIEIHAESVERFVEAVRPVPSSTLILDPPRSGMSRQAADGAIRLGARRVVFVSCDVATFARDVRRFVDAGYRLASVEGIDLFPNTSHVEVLAVLDRA